MILRLFSSRPKKVSFLMLAFVALVSASGAYSIRKLETSYSMRQFMPADHPLYTNDREIKNTFNLADEQPILVTLELDPSQNGTWLEPDKMAALRQATETISQMEGIQAVTSLANVQSASSSEKGITVGTLVDLVPPASWVSRIALDPLLVPGLLSRDYRVATVIGEIGVIPTALGKSLVQNIRTTLSSAIPYARVRVGGVIPMQLDTAQLLTQELQRFLILAFILCVVILLAYFRSFSSIFTCLLLVIISNVGALAWMALAHFPFSILSTSIPVLASITALVIGTHTLINFGNEWSEDLARASNLGAKEKLQRVIQTYRSLFLPNLLMALTTAVGFATLVGSNVPLIRQYAWSISGGIMISWALVSLTLLPLMVLLPVPRVRSWTSKKARWALWVIGNRWVVFSSITLLAIALLLQGGKLNWSVRLFDDLPTEAGVKASAELLDRSLGGIIPLEVMIHSDDPEAWNDPVRVQKIDLLLKKWRQDPAVGTAIGLSDFVRVGENFTKATSNKAIAEIYFLYSLSPHNILTQFLTPDGQSTRLEFRLRDIPSNQIADFVKKVQTDLHSQFPDLGVKVGGMATMVHVLDEELSRQMVTGLWESLLVISLLVILIFRSLRWALTAAVPNLLSPLILLTTMSMMKTPMKPGVAIIFSIALGVAYNNTVYLLSRLRLLQSTRRRHSHSIDQTWYQEGNPCFFSTLTLLGGFAIFLSSYFLLNRTFGAYMLLSICAGLLGDLVFLPSLVKVFPALLNAD
jgi:predicted RND superfamily exporter protein